MYSSFTFAMPFDAVMHAYLIAYTSFHPFLLFYLSREREVIFHFRSLGESILGRYFCRPYFGVCCIQNETRLTSIKQQRKLERTKAVVLADVKVRNLYQEKKASFDNSYWFTSWKNICGAHESFSSWTLTTSHAMPRQGTAF